MLLAVLGAAVNFQKHADTRVPATTPKEKRVGLYYKPSRTADVKPAYSSATPEPPKGPKPTPNCATSVRRIEKDLRRRGLLVDDDGADTGAEGDADRESNLAASAVSGQAPPAGPQWRHGLQPLEAHALAYDKALCASLDEFPLHAGTRAGALDPAGREVLWRYVLRPPVAQERVELRPDGLVRIALKKAYTDATVVVDMDPLSLLCRLATSVPAGRLHTVRYAGVLAWVSQWRSRIAPKPPSEAGAAPFRWTLYGLGS